MPVEENLMQAILLTFGTAMVPVLELRGAIPVGVAAGLSPAAACLVSILGNMVPVPFILLLIRRIFDWLRGTRLFGPRIDWLERRAHLKGRMVRKYRLPGLIILVAIPLPGTGAWTGALVAALLDIRMRHALPAIFLGVVIAGAIHHADLRRGAAVLNLIRGSLSMRKFLFACGMISLMLFTLTACGSEDPAEEISRALHIDVSAGEEISSSDTHGGFHGDGISCVALQFPDSQVADAIAANAAWTPLPLDETAQALAYGVTREDGGEVFSAGPYLTDDSGDPLLPGIANGFYRLIDRHSDAGDGQNLLERASLNVTLAVYDADSDTLYFCEMDT